MITSRVAKLRRDFLGAPVRKAIMETKAGREFEPMEIPYRPSEKYWVMSPGKDMVMVCFSVHFELQDDQALARVLLLEFQGSMKRVQ